MKKKYKHKITGSIAKQRNVGVWYIVEGEYTLPAEYIEQGNDWEEVKEHLPEYTVLSFGENGDLKRIYTLQPDGKYWTGENIDLKQSLNQMIKGYEEDGRCSVEDGTWYIHSVRRNSDGLIVSVGDKVCTSITPEGWLVNKLGEYKVRGMCIWEHVYTDKPECSLESVTKVFKPVLISIDGIQLYEGDKYWAYNTDSKVYDEASDICNLAKDYKEWHWKIFSSESARTKYIDSIKPKVLLTTEDGKDITDGEAEVYKVWTNTWDTGSGKAGYQKVDKYLKLFSTPEDRQEWVEYNKPCLSQKEVMELIQAQTTGSCNIAQQGAWQHLQEKVKCALDTYVQEKLKK